MAAGRIFPGEPAPWFTARSPINPNFKFEAAAGRYCVLTFFGSLADPYAQQVWAGIQAHKDVFDFENACFFGVTNDPNDETSGRAQVKQPGFHWFYDFDYKVSRLYGAVGETANGEVDLSQQRRFTVITDERLRVYGLVKFAESPEQHVAHIVRAIESLPRIEPTRQATVPAPVLIVPRVFESDFCRQLIQYYERFGGVDSGFMRDVKGQTVMVFDRSHKKRRDQTIEDETLKQGCIARLANRLVPEVHKAFQFNATHIERYLIGCYAAETGGHFRAHRDNTTLGTAHRRFAVSVVLNAEEFDGGELRFPEYGMQTYRAPTGGAVVFSCSLLHEATSVTRGTRYVFLPFLYDEAAARIRQENAKFLVLNPSDAPQI